MFFVYYLQAGSHEYSRFLIYIFNRLGIGQMAGVYETFGLIENGYGIEGEFAYHMIPFARFFVNYVDYQKFLMMFTEGYNFTSMGVKNSYFIAEAYAIGGWGLMLLSPIIVSFSFVMGLFILYKFTSYFLSKDFFFAVFIVYLKFMDITGGFSQFPFFKGLILFLAYLFLIGIGWKIYGRILLKGKGYRKEKYLRGRLGIYRHYR